MGDVLDKYNVRFTLHDNLPTSTLGSIYRGLVLMSTISDTEWVGRLDQLRGMVKGRYVVPGVDSSCGVEARLEIYFLKMGVQELEGWSRTVGVALALGGRERRAWAEVYWDAGEFLRQAVREMAG